MPVTLDRLLRRADLRLTALVEGPPGALERPLSWVHATELRDPSPFLDGGELVLTTGAAIPRETDADAEATPADVAHDLVARLASAGVCGVGFGELQHHPVTPPALVQACRAHHLPLLVVPEGTPFIAITKAVARALMDDELEKLNRGYHGQRRLIAAAGAPGATRAIVLRTAELIGGWTALLNADGRTVEASHVSVDRLVRATLPTRRASPEKATFATVDDVDVASYPLFSSAGHHLGYLVAGRRGRTGTLDHGLVAVATTLLSLSMSRNARADRLVRRMRAAAMAELLLHGPAAVRMSGAELWEALPAEPFRLLRVTGEARALTAAHAELEPFERATARAAGAQAFGDAAGALWVLSEADADPGVAERLAGLDPSVTVGVSAPTWWDGLARGQREAVAAAALAGGPGNQVVRFEQAEGASLLELLDDDRAQAFAATQLAPLLGEASARTDLVATLTVWLRTNGRLDAASAELGIHRHTLSKRLARAEELLGRRLDDPDTRAELWFALRVRAAGSPAGDVPVAGDARRPPEPSAPA